MRVRTQIFWQPKVGNKQEDYEDAFFPETDQDLTVDSFCCAIADGATETSFAALWAQLLTKMSVEKLSFDEAKANWSAAVYDRPLPWYAEQKREQGAFAALLDFELFTGANGYGAEGNGTWKSRAIGDSCLFHFRGAELIQSFPLSSVEEFGNSPELISSKSTNQEMRRLEQIATGSWRDGDVFYLMSDALSLWTLLRQRYAGDAVQVLNRLSGSQAFAEFVTEMRAKPHRPDSDYLRNDDFTLLRVLPQQTN